MLIGLAHSALQFAGLAVVIVVASRLSSALGRGVASLLASSASCGVLGGMGGAVGISGYLWATNCLGFHGNEAYAPLHHADHKNFLRLHIDADGALTVYPIGIDRVGRKWRLRPDADAGAPWLEPDGGEPEAPPHRAADPARPDDECAKDAFIEGLLYSRPVTGGGAGGRLSGASGAAAARPAARRWPPPPS